MDKSLSFLPHLKQKRLEVQSIVQSLYKFTSLSGRLPPSFIKIWYSSILQRKLAYACSVWYPRMWSSHGSRHLLSAQRSAMLLMTRAYRKTSTPALQVITGLPPLDLQLSSEAEYSRVARLGVSTQLHFAPLYSFKTSKHILPPFWKGIELYDETQPLTPLQIYTDGSKINQSVGSAYCCYNNNLLIKEWKSGLQSENSVFQAELLAIQQAILWFSESNFHICTINTDSLSGLLALKDNNSTDYSVHSILILLKNLKKQVLFRWIRGHAGLRGNEHADALAKEAAQDPPLFTFVPLPLSSLKLKLKTTLFQNWQLAWNNNTKGRFTYQFLPRVSSNFQIQDRELILFLTNHGPFQSYLFKINSSPSPFCVCGKFADSLHYVFDCPLTARFHVKRDPNIPLSN